MSGQYFDAVLDDRMQPIFNGTPEQTKEWLRENTAIDPSMLQVCIGSTMRLVSVGKYLEA